MWHSWLNTRPAAARIVALLAITEATCPGAVITHSELLEWLWPDADKQPLSARGYMKLEIHRARVALAPHGLAIGVRWGSGYYLAPITPQVYRSQGAAGRRAAHSLEALYG
jgi:hypothetical protein